MTKRRAEGVQGDTAGEHRGASDAASAQQRP
jgi:hypothetical protein